MFHVLQQPQLSVRSLGMDDGLKWPREFLHSYLHTNLKVKCRTVGGQTCELEYKHWLRSPYSHE